MKNINRVGVDIAKSVFHVHAVDRHDETLWWVKLKRSQWLDVLCDRLAPGAAVWQRKLDVDISQPLRPDMPLRPGVFKLVRILQNTLFGEDREN